MAKVHQLKLSQKQVKDAVRKLLSWASDDPDRQRLKETPSRVARALALKAALGKFHIFQQLSNIEQRVGNPEEQVSSHHRSASWAVIGDRECCAPAYSREASCPSLNSFRPSRSLKLRAPPVRCARPRCCLPASRRRAWTSLHTFECAVCDHVLKTLTAYEDPMKSRALGRWLAGDLRSPK
jgi:hypothetical protein